MQISGHQGMRPPRSASWAGWPSTGGALQLNAAQAQGWDAVSGIHGVL